MPGRLLGHEAISKRIDRGAIFDSSSFSPSSLRGAAYDLRLARDFLITPDGRAYGPKQQLSDYGGDNLILKPGDVAYVASHERVRLPWDIAANIVPKYAFAQCGLMVLHGGLVDPGYGFRKVSPGCWVERDDERLHFLLTNISGGNRVLRLGEEKIATLQFFCIEEVPEHERREIRSAAATWERHAVEPEQLLAALDFFKSTTATGRELRERVEHTETTNERVVAFGVYVMAAALLTGSMAVLVALFSTQHRVVSIHFETQKGLEWQGLALIGFAVALGAIGARCIVTLAGAISGRRRRPLDGRRLHDRSKLRRRRS
ncbi:MAG: 2'-deoxycytidine 5'-triphosphate deaminase [Solirubrobacteraceae bacterium]